MSTYVPGFQLIFSGFWHLFVLAKLAIDRIRVKGNIQYTSMISTDVQHSGGES